MKANNIKYLMEYITTNNISGEYYYSELFDIVFIDNKRISTCSDETSKFRCYYIIGDKVNSKILHPSIKIGYKKADITIRNILLLEEI